MATPDSCSATKICSFDHLVHKHLELAGDRHTKVSCGLQIDDQFEFGRLLHGQCEGLRPLEDSVDMPGGLSRQIGQVHAVGRKPSERRELPRRAHAGQPTACREGHDALVLGIQHRAGHHDEPLHASGSDRGERAIDFVRTVRRHELQPHAQRLGGGPRVLQ